MKVPKDINENLIKLLNKIIELVSTRDTNMVWSTYDTKEVLILELKNYIQRLQNNDFSPIEQLISLFLPTGDLQEIAISSGWGEEYLSISKKFEFLELLFLFFFLFCDYYLLCYKYIVDNFENTVGLYFNNSPLNE